MQNMNLRNYFYEKKHLFSTPSTNVPQLDIMQTYRNGQKRF